MTQYLVIRKGDISTTNDFLIGSILFLFMMLMTSCGSSKLASSDASLAETNPEQYLRENIEAHAESFIGLPHGYGSKGPSSFDCSGFTSHVLREFKIALLGSSKSQAKQGRAVDIEEAKPGDLVYFVNSKGKVNHVALLVEKSDEGLEVIHATTSKGVVRDNISKSSYWKPKMAGIRCVVDCRATNVASSF